MAIVTAYCTDKGNVKEVNQDALLIKTATTSMGDIALIAVCDGVGGLQKGELASSTMVKYLGLWFQNQLPQILTQYHMANNICQSLKTLIHEVNEELRSIGRESGIKLGTTLTAMLLIDRQYYVVHVGDTRLYEISDDIVRITNDQTVVAKEVEMNRLTPEEAEQDPRRNILLQCIGGTENLMPEFLSGQMKEAATYVICCDGFRHKVSNEEIQQGFNRIRYGMEEELYKQCHELVELNKKRMERDNITVVALQCI